METVLDARTLTLSTPRGARGIVSKHDRPGGDVDVILARRHKGARDVALFAFRRDQGQWTQLAGSWSGLDQAIKRAAKTTKRQVFTATYLVPLLDSAAKLPDFPPPVQEWLTVTEAAELVGVSKDSIRYRVQHDQVEYRQDGRRYEVTKESVLAAFKPGGGTACAK